MLSLGKENISLLAPILPLPLGSRNFEPVREVAIQYLSMWWGVSLRDLIRKHFSYTQNAGLSQSAYAQLY